MKNVQLSHNSCSLFYQEKYDTMPQALARYHLLKDIPKYNSLFIIPKTIVKGKEYSVNFYRVNR